MQKIKKSFFYIGIILFTSCGNYYQTNKVTFTDYRISQYRKTDSTYSNLLKPYYDSVHKTMFDVIGNLPEALEKRAPNGTLGLFFVDALKEMAAIKYNTNIDAAFLNNGGFRIPSIPAGNITVGKIFEIMPFDNLVYVQKIDGKTFLQFLNLITRKGGWPVSGIKFDIVNGKPTNIIINNLPFDENKTYNIANSDYIASGGDDCEMLKKVPFVNKNILIRDVFIEYIKMKTAKGISLDAPTDSRINIK